MKACTEIWTGHLGLRADGGVRLGTAQDEPEFVGDEQLPKASERKRGGFERILSVR